MTLVLSNQLYINRLSSVYPHSYPQVVNNNYFLLILFETLI